MKCNRVEALIMDYIDGELNAALHKNVVRHLDICSSCKKMEQSLRRVIVEPLRQAGKIQAPDRIWYQLKEAIINKKEEFSLPNLIAEWSNYFRVKRPILVPVTVMIVVVLFIVTLFFGRILTTQNMLNAYMEEQVQFISQLAENGEESYFGIGEVNLGTAIEKYLL